MFKKRSNVVWMQKRRAFSRPQNNLKNQKNGVDYSKYVNTAVAPVEQEVFVPKHSFADFRVHPLLKGNIARKGYKTPMPIQDKSIPFALEGRDIIGIANTGTGKTAAFLIPTINKILHHPRARVLIVTPTRELAAQIEQEFRSLVPGLRMYSVLCIGGSNMNRQIDALARHPQFVIGTPGRLKDLTNQGYIRYEAFSTIILDEVDRMFDMGFLPDIKFLLGRLPARRQSLFFSATMTAAIEKLIAENVHNPIKIDVKVRETAASIEQKVVHFNGRDEKLEKLHDLLIQEDKKKVIIFGNTKWGVQKLSINLNKRGFKTEALHGNKSQSQRQNALDQFKTDRLNVLVATDVAARGLDISGVTHVINYDVPVNHDDYIHRIGRTGRANNTGVALTFVEK